MEKDHLEILLEDIQGKFELVLEGHESLRKEIRGARDESNRKHEHTAFLIGVLNVKIDDVEQRLDKKIDGVEVRLDKKIDGVAERLDKKIDDVEATLSRKIDSVEAELGRKIDAVASDLAEHRADTEGHTKAYKVSDGKE